MWLKSTSVVTAVTLFGSVAGAEEFSILGSRAMGMGGAGVALTRGSLSTYWNPAALAPPSTASVLRILDLSVPAHATITASNDALRQIDELVNRVDALDFNAIESSLTSGTTLTTQQVLDLIAVAAELPELDVAGTGLITDLAVGLDLRLWRFGLNTLGTFHGGGVTNLDTQILALGTNGLAAVIPALGGAPATAEGIAFSSFLLGTGTVTPAQADQLAFFAEQAGVDLDDPGFRDLMADVLDATDANTGGSITNLLTNNTSGVDLRGIFTQEVSIGYAQPLGELLPLPLLDRISIGAAVKVVRGTTYFNSFDLSGLNQFDDIFTELMDDSTEETSLGVGVDVGVLLEPLDWVSIGLVARNLNRPSFDFGGPGDYRLDPQVRAGIGLVDVIDGVTIAADVDLTRNHSDAFTGWASQIAGVGLEYDVGNMDVVFLRLGVSKNLADADESYAGHVGLGARFLGVAVDVAGMITSDFVDIDADPNPDEVPERAGVGLEVSVLVPID